MSHCLPTKRTFGGTASSGGSPRNRKTMSSPFFSKDAAAASARSASSLLPRDPPATPTTRPPSGSSSAILSRAREGKSRSGRLTGIPTGRKDGTPSHAPHPEATTAPHREARRVTRPATAFCSWMTTGILLFLQIRRGGNETYPPKRTQTSGFSRQIHRAAVPRDPRRARERSSIRTGDRTPRGEPSMGRI